MIATDWGCVIGIVLISLGLGGMAISEDVGLPRWAAVWATGVLVLILWAVRAPVLG